MGNLRSVTKALEAAGAAVELVSEARAVQAANALCVPGQGIFGRCMSNLDKSGVANALRDHIASGKRYLGICLGMQILFERSNERGAHEGLGIFSGEVTRLQGDVPVPHIGWNLVNDVYYYFDHSFAARPADASIVTGWCDHGERFAAAVERDNVAAFQFHPEKSSRAGIDLLRAWIAA